ncbi:MAG: Fe-S-containing protein [Pseudoflavonifractor sp.]|nr:Fe-S-containing protein [Pseudoflavonifractor sp.]
MLALVLGVAGLVGCTAAVKTPEADAGAAPQETAMAAAGETADMTIPEDELTGTPRFYATEVEGTPMEVIALLASDGKVRTAFNTCQVCYSSGRGYYKANGDELVCQNCGNRFVGDAVGIVGGGCNPVPILEKESNGRDDIIVISGELLVKTRAIF